MKKALQTQGFHKAAGLGFEPRLLGPEPSVLPLDDPATRGCGSGECSRAFRPLRLEKRLPYAASAAQSPYSDV
jgi:hypothetical protein